MTPKLKSPGSTLDFGFTWDKWLPAGAVLASSSWGTPVGITAVTESYSDTVSSITISGGMLGETYDLTNKITYTLNGSTYTEVRILSVFITAY